MNRFIIQNTDRFMIATLGGGVAVQIADKKNSIDTLLQGDDATQFLESLENMQMAYQNPNSVWHGATWNGCLAEVCDEILEVSNSDHLGWRKAGLAAGWKFAEIDPSDDRATDGPCLVHEEQGRAWPLGDWEGAVRDLGYSSPEDVFSSLDPEISPA